MGYGSISFGLRIPAFISLLSTVMLFVQFSFQAVYSQNDSGIAIYSLDDKPYGDSYSQWTANWWKWFLSIPTHINPATDQTGEHCGVNQAGLVWFLATTTGGKAERQCVIPEDKSILIPTITSSCSVIKFPQLKTEEELRDCAKEFQDKAINLEFTLNGIKLEGLEKYRIQTPLMTLNYPEGNVFGMPSGETKVIADGNWIFLKPLPLGEYELIAKGGETPDPTGGEPFTTEARYHITIR